MLLVRDLWQQIEVGKHCCCAKSCTGNTTHSREDGRVMMISSCHIMHTYTAIIPVLHCRGPVLIKERWNKCSVDWWPDRSVVPDMYWNRCWPCRQVSLTVEFSDRYYFEMRSSHILSPRVIPSPLWKKLNIINSFFTWRMTSQLSENRLIYIIILYIIQFFVIKCSNPMYFHAGNVGWWAADVFFVQYTTCIPDYNTYTRSKQKSINVMTYIAIYTFDLLQSHLIPASPSYNQQV